MSSSSTAGHAASATPSSTRFLAAVVQMTSGEDMAENLRVVSEQIRAAAKAGATFIATPENTGRMTALTQRSNSLVAAAPSASTPPLDENSAPPPASRAPRAEQHPVLLGLQSLARELQVHILVGSLAVRIEGEETRVANRSFLLAPREVRIRSKPIDTQSSTESSGSDSSKSTSILASYSKIHCFDVPSLNGTESYLESARIVPGDEAVLCPLLPPLQDVVVGMSVCYDLRFPHLYRALAKAGANLLVVPSAFTVVTGRAHWETLLRARAIENGCFLIAPAQVGIHPGERHTYGHSIIVSPWGEVLADAGEQSPGFVMAEIDLQQVADARRRIPSLTHDRPFTVVKRQPIEDS